MSYLRKKADTAHRSPHGTPSRSGRIGVHAFSVYAEGLRCMWARPARMRASQRDKLCASVSVRVRTRLASNTEHPDPTAMREHTRRALAPARHAAAGGGPSRRGLRLALSALVQPPSDTHAARSRATLGGALDTQTSQAQAYSLEREAWPWVYARAPSSAMLSPAIFSTSFTSGM